MQGQARVEYRYIIGGLLLYLHKHTMHNHIDYWPYPFILSALKNGSTQIQVLSVAQCEYILHHDYSIHHVNMM